MQIVRIISAPTQKGAPKGSPLWRIAGYIYETVISGSVTIFSAKGSSLMVLLFYSAVSDVQVSFSMIVNELASGSLARVQRHAAFFHSIKQISPEQPSFMTRSSVS